MKYQQHQGRNEKTDRSFHQCGKSGGHGADQIPDTTRVSLRFLGPKTGENGRGGEETERDIENDGACIHQKERCGGQHNGSQGRTTDAIFLPTEKVG